MHAGLENQVIFEIPTALECVTPQGVTEGSSSAPPCEFLAPTRVGLSDGLLPSESTFLLNSAAFGDKLQVLMFLNTVFRFLWYAHWQFVSLGTEWEVLMQW